MALNLKIIKREASGKKEARKLRHEGFIPGIVYGDSREPILIAVGEKELLAECYSLAFLGQVIEVKLGSETEKLLPKEVVFHPVTDKPIHIDFQRISKNSMVKVGISVEFINEDKSPGLKKGGVINTVIHKLECYCSPENIPEKITVDLSGKEIGDTLLLESIKLPEGVSPINPDRDSIVATLVGARISAAETEETESTAENGQEENAA